MVGVVALHRGPLPAWLRAPSSAAAGWAAAVGGHVRLLLVLLLPEVVVRGAGLCGGAAARR